MLSDILGKLSIPPVHLGVKSVGCHAFCQLWGVLTRKAVGEPRACQRCPRTGEVWPSPAVIRAARMGRAPTPRCAVMVRGNGGPGKARALGGERCSQLCFYSTRKTLHAFDAKLINYTFIWINYFKMRELHYLFYFMLTLRVFYWKTSAVMGALFLIFSKDNENLMWELRLELGSLSLSPYSLK